MADASTASWQSIPFPTDVVAQLFNESLTTSPFTSNITRRSTGSNAVGYPTINPTGAGWTAELGAVPALDLGDDALVAQIKKLIAQGVISHEALMDASFDIGSAIGRGVADTFAGLLDPAGLYGDQPDEPAGVVAALGAALDNSDLSAAAADGIGALYAAGGTPSRIFCAPDVWTAEAQRISVDNASSGSADALQSIFGVPLTVVPTMTAGTGLVADTSRIEFVVREDIAFELNEAAGWNVDGVGYRLRTRVAYAVPTPAKAGVNITVTPSGG